LSPGIQDHHRNAPILHRQQKYRDVDEPDRSVLSNPSSLRHNGDMASNDARLPTETMKRLRRLFAEHGWIHSAPASKKRRKAQQSDKRGYEARLSVSPDDLRAVLRLLDKAGLEPGKPFAKGNMLRVPIYGKAQIERLQRILNIK
jgi:hypothetical protein